jgi:hypothetical protein
MWLYTSTPPCASWRSAKLVTHRDNFTFLSLSLLFYGFCSVGYYDSNIYTNLHKFTQISAECENCLFALSPIVSFCLDDITHFVWKPLDIVAAIYSFVTDGIALLNSFPPHPRGAYLSSAARCDMWHGWLQLLPMASRWNSNVILFRSLLSSGARKLFFRPRMRGGGNSYSLSWAP